MRRSSSARFIFTRKALHLPLDRTERIHGHGIPLCECFDGKWIRNERVTGESQLGTPDIQTLADLTTSVDVVRGMHVAPFTRRLLLELALPVILPLLPLLFLQYPLSQVVGQLFHILSGL
jgi:hypothetical protein